ncbi:MAG: hypothetical protein JWN48_174 [Myxococcaceae bacterium]|nr:hypothetical protein [Myxococcaceae bacterium]
MAPEVQRVHPLSLVARALPLKQLDSPEAMLDGDTLSEAASSDPRVGLGSKLTKQSFLGMNLYRAASNAVGALCAQSACGAERVWESSREDRRPVFIMPSPA